MIDQGNLSIEQSESFFLGWLLQHPERLMDSKINTCHFTSEFNRRVYDCMQSLESKGLIIDVITVNEELSVKYPQTTDMSLAHLGQMVQDSFTESFFNSAQMVMLARHKEREIKKIAGALFESFDSDLAIQDLMKLDQVEHKYSHSTGEAVMAAIEKAQETAKQDGLSGLSTGLIELDKAIGGLQSPDLYVIGARPAMGKTAFIINLMLNNNKSVGFFSTEQPHEQVGLRMISMTSAVPARTIRTASFDESQMNSMSYSVTKLAGKQIHIYDKGFLSITELMREARRMKYNYDVQCIYIDYIQRVRAKAENRRLEVAEVVTSLKSLAKELKIPVVGLAQVNRKVEERADKRPGMGDLLESGVIEQEADVVMLLYRDEVYDENSQFKGTIEVLIDKNRHGPIGKLSFAWLGETMQVKNLSYARNEI